MALSIGAERLSSCIPLYNTAAWRKLRSHQLTVEPLSLGSGGPRGCVEQGALPEPLHARSDSKRRAGSISLALRAEHRRPRLPSGNAPKKSFLLKNRALVVCSPETTGRCRCTATRLTYAERHKLMSNWVIHGAHVMMYRCPIVGEPGATNATSWLGSLGGSSHRFGELGGTRNGVC
jgi:hypothetical protein